MSDQANKDAEELLSCEKSCRDHPNPGWGGFVNHAITCPVHYRPAVAAKLRERDELYRFTEKECVNMRNEVDKLNRDAVSLREEIGRLKAFVGEEILRSDYQTALAMRSEIERLKAENASFLKFIKEIEEAADECTKEPVHLAASLTAIYWRDAARAEIDRAKGEVT